MFVEVFWISLFLYGLNKHKCIFQVSSATAAT